VRWSSPSSQSPSRLQHFGAISLSFALAEHLVVITLVIIASSPFAVPLIIVFVFVVPVRLVSLSALVLIFCTKD
jgi:hypothetical protein